MKRSPATLVRHPRRWKIAPSTMFDSWEIARRKVSHVRFAKVLLEFTHIRVYPPRRRRISRPFPGLSPPTSPFSTGTLL